VQLMSNSRSLARALFRAAGTSAVGAASFLLVTAGSLGACASAPRPQPEVAHQMSPSEEAEAIEAAKRHPIALTYERRRAPEASLPVAPAQIPPEPAAPPPPPQQVAEAPAQPPASRDQVIVVGNDPAPPASARTYTWPSTDESYDNVDDAWVAGPSARTYVDTPWVASPTWGWGVRYRYPRPWVYPPAVYAPPVIVVPGPSPRHWNSYPRPRSWGYDRPRLSTPRYTAPRYDAPVYRAPAAPRREVHVAPPAVRSAPRAAPSRGASHSAPSRRSVRMH
jgi:hypothetical protein